MPTTKGPTALLLDTPPANLDAAKGARPGEFRITGQKAYAMSVGRALLEHGTFDEYYFIGGAGASARGAAADPRLRLLSPTQLPSLAGLERLVIMSTVADMYQLLPVRLVLRRPDWPMFGTIHATSGAVLASTLLSFLIDPYYAHDALACSTRSGRRVVERQLEGVCERLRAAGFPHPRSPVALPVIPIGVETSQFQRVEREAARAKLDLPREPVVMLYFGRFSQMTKADLGPLLLAFREVWLTRPDARLVLAGDDFFNLTPSLRAASDLLGIGGAVRIEPNPDGDRKREWFAAADIFVAVSDNLQETFGIAIAEAMAAGLPVVAADWDGHRELVSDGETGFLIPTTMPRLGPALDMLNSSRSWLGDYALAMTTAIDLGDLTRQLGRLVANPELRRRMGDEARRRAVRQFDWRVVVAAYEEVWTASLDQARAFAGAQHTHAVAGIFTYDYQRVYEHYPTRLGDDDDGLLVSGAAAREAGSEESREESSAAWKLLLAASPGFEPRLFTAIANHAQACPGATVGETVRVLVEAGAGDEFLVRSHIGRLVKYGLVAYAATQEVRR